MLHGTSGHSAGIYTESIMWRGMYQVLSKGEMVNRHGMKRCYDARSRTYFLTEELKRRS